MEEDTGYFQFRLISLLVVLIQGVKVAIYGSPRTTGPRFYRPRGVTRTSKRTCLVTTPLVQGGASLHRNYA